jgi:NTP pyrophosphatase (non-canonical NTP hydrolase)
MLNYKGYMMTKNEELLLITQEECAEVTQAISKVFRFGFDSEHNGVTNKERLTEEVGDLLCMLELMMSHGMIDSMEVLDAKKNKYEKLKKWSSVTSLDV